MMKSHFRLRFGLVILLFGALLPSAAAQGALDAAEPTGTITGALGESPLQWNTLQIAVDGEAQHTATYNVMMDMFYNFTLQGHQDGNLVEGSVSIVFSSLSGPLTDCPCEFTGDISYWTTTSMFDDVYIGSDATITILEAEELPDGDMRLVGTAEGELHFYTNVMQQEQTGETMAAVLEFSVERVGLVELDF